MIYLRNIEDRAIANRANRKSQDRRLHHRGDRNIAGRKSLMFVKYCQFIFAICDLAIGVIADRQILRFFLMSIDLLQYNVRLNTGGLAHTNIIRE